MAVRIYPIENLLALAVLANVTVKEHSFEGRNAVVCGSGFHIIYDPYRNKEQALDLLFRVGLQVEVQEDVVLANGTVYPMEDYDQSWHALCDAICSEALKK